MRKKVELPTGPILIAGQTSWDHRFCDHSDNSAARTACRIRHNITAVMPG